ncbi:MAG: hypothetical protein DYG98_04715 [Haliscomenobacteraceae bacterium CHB4]|nr:hypothetical protein [Haliscomenobacteraceae bacterium CHB4]
MSLINTAHRLLPSFPPSPKFRRINLLLLLPLFSACGSQNKPLDADTRQAIDSISQVQINIARQELDTLCQQRRLTELPRMIDSIKQHRLREIQEQLKTVPK